LQMKFSPPYEQGARSRPLLPAIPLSRSPMPTVSPGRFATCGRRAERGQSVAKSVSPTATPGPKFRADAPIWGYVYASTVHDLEGASHASLTGVVEPRIEPEIIFGLAGAPTPNMDEESLTGCLAWVAHGFEIVHSIYPNWDCLAADAVAGFGMHSSLWIGPHHVRCACERMDARVDDLRCRALPRRRLRRSRPSGQCVGCRPA
jgi:hypothetical protein